MDPLSISASIAGLISLGAAIVSNGYVLFSKIKRRSEDIQALVNEVASFSGLLVGLQAHLNSEMKTQENPSLHGIGGFGRAWDDAIGECRNILQKVTSLLEELQIEKPLRLALNRDSMTGRAGELISRIERYKTFFILCFQLNGR